MKHIFKYSFIIALFFAFTSCIEKLKEAAESITASANQPESVSASNFSTITTDGRFELSIPKYMKNMPSLHDEASLEYANIYKETYTVVIEENKEDFIVGFKEFGEYDDALSPIENYTNVQKKMFREVIDDIKFQDYGLIDINNLPARQFKMEGVIDGLDFFYVVGFVEGEQNIYMVMNWTMKDRKYKYENTFEYINASFKEL